MNCTANRGPVGQHFSFDWCSFEHVLAHGGKQEISFARALQRGRGPIRFIDLSVLDPGADIGIHTHQTDNEELYIVLSGIGWMTLDGQEFEVRPGHVVLNRPGGTHALRNIGSEELRIVVLELEVKTDESRDSA
jgi:quercetin dioxygenase-like cupin family protein